MPDKVGKTRHKGGRPNRQTQTKHEKDCLEFYEAGKSAGYAALKLKLNRHTVEKYFKKFRDTEIEETSDEFIKRQRVAKHQCITKLDEMIDNYEEQLVRYMKLIEQVDTTDETNDGQRVESNYSDVVKKLADLAQQKASIEMELTLDINVDKLVREKYDNFISSQKS